MLDGETLNPGDNSWDEIASFGDLKVYPRTNPGEVINRSHEAEIILTNKTPVRRKTIEELPLLKYIGVLATGYDVVDIEIAKKRGIIVTNIPEYGTNSVAQFEIALMLELCHHIGIHDKAVKDGEWTNCPDFSFTKTNLIELY